MEKYSYTKKSSSSYEETVKQVKVLLLDKGFGILTESDIQAKIKEKLGKDFGKYLILGACNPPSAYEAIGHEIEIGLLLPYNVIVYEKDGDVFVSAIRPTVSLKIVNNPRVEKVARFIEDLLTQVVDEVV